jgi:hypothetical protein
VESNRRGGNALKRAGGATRKRKRETDMRTTTIAVALVAAMGVGAALGASIRPAQAGGNDDEHRIAVATEQIGRQIENVSRHLEGMQRCTCK